LGTACFSNRLSRGDHPSFGSLDTFWIGPHLVNEMSHPTGLSPPSMYGGLLTVALAVTGACADARSPSRVTVDTLESGIVVVTNAGSGIWGGRSAWRLTEEVRIGARDGAGRTVFGDIRSLALDRLGRVYVVDYHADEIRLFDTDGSYVRAIGRRGRGPGELHGPSGIRIDPAGRLWVQDLGNQRYSVFDTTGLLVQEHPLRGGLMAVEWTDGVFTRAGDLYDRVPVWFGRRGRTGFGRYDTLRGEFVDTVPQPPFPPGTQFPFGRSTATPRGWWMGVRSAYRFWEVAWAGDTIRIVERPSEPSSLTEQQRDSVLQAVREMKRLSRGEVDLDVPELQPIFDWMLVDDRDYLWVMLTPGPEAERRRSTCSIPRACIWERCMRPIVPSTIGRGRWCAVTGLRS